MLNWCDCTYKCTGEPKEVKSLYRVLKYIEKRKTSIVKNGFGKWWLGNFVIKLGGDWKKYRCRGEIIGYDYDMESNVLTIYQSTAWCEQEGVREIIEERFPSIKVYYREEEPGCGVYYTNDSNGEYFPERYYLDSYEDCEYFRAIEEAADCISEIVGKTIPPTENDIVQALDDYVEQHDDEDIWYSFHVFEIVE